MKQKYIKLGIHILKTDKGIIAKIPDNCIGLKKKKGKR
jgi:hypothetical protein